MGNFVIKNDMLLGVATAATQIEGGDTNNNWNDWFKKGKIKDGSDPARADDHYNRYHEDAEIMASLSIKTYRFGIEWSRIEPTEGVFSKEAIDHYRNEILLMITHGIKPLLTLHHFNNPMWLEDLGGFENPKVEQYFLRFVNKVVRSLGDIVSEFLTINEPNVFATTSYFFGSWPPGKKSFSSVIKVYENFTRCHIAAYTMIHEIRKEMGFSNTKVSFANHIRVFEPKQKWNPYHLICTVLLRQLFQNSITKAMSTGKPSFPIGRLSGINPGKYYDFIGINYYSRSTVSRFGDGVRENSPVNDLGWEIYPDGILRCARMLYDKYKAPIYITENGTCDNSDKFRCRYIYEHLKVLCESDLPIERYYHWCFLDNFEWIEGESARFGIVHVDFDTQVRTIKRSGEFYSQIIRLNGVTEDLYNEFAVQDYNTN